LHGHYYSSGTSLAHVLFPKFSSCVLKVIQLSVGAQASGFCRGKEVKHVLGARPDLVSPYRAVNTHRLGYKNQPVNVV
jgi:hypothetical protein